MVFYEIMVVFNSRINSEDVDNLMGKLKEIISSNGGEILLCNHLGKRLLAYEIKKCTEGNFFCLGITAPPTISFLIEKYCKMTDEIVRHMIVKKKNISVKDDASSRENVSISGEEENSQEKQVEMSNVAEENNITEENK
ncbi:30S ribosomal protein S6 [bacterium]|nr:30S ribosomal protein S6 [bacterium]